MGSIAYITDKNMMEYHRLMVTLLSISGSQVSKVLLILKRETCCFS